MLLDGALFRKSLCAPEVSEGILLSSGASYSPDMLRTVQDTAFAARMLMLPLTKLFNGKQVGEERQLYLDESGEVRPFSAWEEAFASSGVLLLGAVTDKRVENF